MRQSAKPAMSISRKKVIVRTLDGERHRGYLPAVNLASEGLLDFLLLDGTVAIVALDRVRYVAYVKNFNADDRVNPERIGLQSFPSKPRGPGLWVRVQFADECIQEGLVPTGLPLLDALLTDRGIFLEPPDRNSNTQRLFIPRSALIGFETLGVAGRVLANSKRASARTETQGALFGDPGEA